VIGKYLTETKNERLCGEIRGSIPIPPRQQTLDFFLFFGVIENVQD
jgi:hypothetical protein